MRGQLTLPIEAEELAQSQRDEEAWEKQQQRQRAEAWAAAKAEYLIGQPDPERVLTRAFSIRQPWLQIIMLGLKTWEFRSKPHGRPGWTFALHASKRFDRDWRRILREAGASPETPGPVGGICAVATLGDCVTLGARPDQMSDEAWEKLERQQLRVPEDEPGRPRWSGDRVWFAWKLRDVIAVEPPLPWKGQQGVWNVPRRAREQLLERLQV